MGRVISVGLAGLAFFIAFGVAMKGPKWTGSAQNYGYYTSVAIVGSRLKRPPPL